MSLEHCERATNEEISEDEQTYDRRHVGSGAPVKHRSGELVTDAKDCRHATAARKSIGKAKHDGRVYERDQTNPHRKNVCQLAENCEQKAEEPKKCRGDPSILDVPLARIRLDGGL